MNAVQGKVQRTIEITVAEIDYTVGIDEGKPAWVEDPHGNEPSSRRTDQVMEAAVEYLDSELNDRFRVEEQELDRHEAESELEQETETTKED